jgi:hypothetical protein
MSFVVRPQPAGIYRPKYQLHCDDFGRPLTEEEKQAWTDFSYEMGYDHVHLLCNADVRLNTMNAPMGYVASMHADSPFCYSAFCGHELFRGMARVALKCELALKGDGRRERIMEECNKRIRDASPIPPKLGDSADGGWVCALGQSGFLRIDKAAKALGEPFTYYISVVAGLPGELLEEVIRLMHPRSPPRTMREMFIGPEAVLAGVREIAKMNRARLLCEFAMAIAVAQGRKVEDLVDSVTECPMEYTSNGPDNWPGEWLYVPAWYRAPRMQPRLVKQLVSKRNDAAIRACPSYIRLLSDVMFCDVVLIEPDEVAVYASAICTKRRSEVPFIKAGPLGTIDVYNAEGNEWMHKEKLHAFPAEGRYVPQRATPSSAVDVTWEHPGLSENRMANADWVFEPPGAKPLSARYGKAIELTSKDVMMLEIVRLASRDPQGFASDPDPAAGRFAHIYDARHRDI